jgi:enterochelin esterase-like enzyme
VGAAAAAGAGFVLLDEPKAVEPETARPLTTSSAVPTTTTTAAETPASMTSGSFRSAARNGIDTAWTLYRPASTKALHPVIALHGKGGNHSMVFDLGVEALLAQAIQDGTPPFAVIAVDGGDGYFHRRANGEDSGKMVVDELIPMLTGMGLDTSRIGLLGWSMGGYGALLLGAQLGPQRTAAIAAVSPALWTSAGATAPGAFDGASDYDANDVFDRTSALADIPVRIDCGNSDPFYSAAQQFVSELAAPPSGSFSPGGHDGNYWHGQLLGELEFLGANLAK